MWRRKARGNKEKEKESNLIRKVYRMMVYMYDIDTMIDDNKYVEYQTVMHPMIPPHKDHSLQHFYSIWESHLRCPITAQLLSLDQARLPWVIWTFSCKLFNRTDDFLSPRLQVFLKIFKCFFLGKTHLILTISMNSYTRWYEGERSK